MAEISSSRSIDPESRPRKRPDLKLQKLEDIPGLDLPKSTSEKVIFCLDENLLSKQYKTHRRDYAVCLWSALSAFVATKKRICTTPTEFYLMPLNGAPCLYPLTDDVSGQDILHELRSGISGNNEIPYDLSKMFTALAQQLELPDPDFYMHSHSPPHAYHVILLFGGNNPPEVTNYNSYYFLQDNPYFILDILHIKHSSIPQSQYSYVHQVLRGLLGSTDFCFTVDATRNNELGFYLNKLLGHCIFRSQQKSLQSLQT